MTRVYTSGVFDLFHVGHLRFLTRARALGDFLLVGVVTDEDSESYKRTPIIPFAQRIEILQGLACVDEVIVGPLTSDADFYREHRIDIHCQGEPHSTIEFYQAARELGIMRFLGRDDTTCSTDIMRQVLQSIGEEN